MAELQIRQHARATRRTSTGGHPASPTGGLAASARVARAAHAAVARRAPAAAAFETMEDRILYSHFRYAELNWNPGAAQNEAVFHLTESYRRDYSTFGKSVGATGADGHVVVGDTLDTGTTLTYGDGASAEIYLKITSVDLAKNLFVGTMVDKATGAEGLHHTYAAGGTYTASTVSCCRLSTLDNDHDDDYEMQTTVTPGSGNSSPVSSLAPIVQVADNTVDTFQVPAVDPNRDPLHYRLATSAEASGLTSGYTTPPGLTVSPTGLVTWDIRNSVVTTAPGDLWTTQVMVEDVTAAGVVKSKTPVDFILQVTDATSNQPPVFDSIPTALKPTANTQLTFNVQASDPNAADTVTLQALNAPAGMTFKSTPVTAGSRANAVAIQASFTPTVAQAGQSFVVTFEATDSHGATTDSSVTISPTVAAPVADAGGPYAITAGDGVALNAGKSTGTAPLTYAWDVNGDGVYGDATGVSPTLTAAQLAALGVTGGTTAKVYNVRVKVTDGSAQTATSPATTLTVNPAGVTPVPNAGGPYATNEGGGVSLTAAASHFPAGVTYSWDVNGDGTFGDTTGVSPTLTWTQLKSLGITDGNATSIYTVRVKITNGATTLTSPATTLTVRNVAPTANAGPDQTTTVGKGVSLAGSFTDPGDIDTQTFAWTVTNAGGTTVATSTAQKFTFTPNAPGTYTATLTVTDDDGGRGTDSALVTATTVAQTGPSVTRFTLVDADTDRDIETLTDGMTLDLSTLPRRLNVRANTSPATVGSVLIGLDGKAHIERQAPYALFDDNAADYAAGTFADGTHVLAAKAFTGPDGTGTAGTLTAISIRVIGRPPTAATAVTSIVLYNTATGKDIRVLKDFDALSLSTLPKTLGIRVVTSGSPASVVYVVDAKVGVAATNALAVGTHTLTVLPYSGASQTGVEGASMQLRLFITK